MPTSWAETTSRKAPIIAGVVGGVAGAFLLVALAVFLTRRRRQRQPSSKLDLESDDDDSVDRRVSFWR